MDKNGSIWSTGNNTFGQLALNDNQDRNKFEQVNSQAQYQNITCCDQHLMTLDVLGNLYVCGYNRYGQLGLGDNADRNILTFVSKNVKLIINNRSYRSKIKNSIF